MEISHDEESTATKTPVEISHEESTSPDITLDWTALKSELAGYVNQIESQSLLNTLTLSPDFIPSTPPVTSSVRRRTLTIADFLLI